MSNRQRAFSYQPLDSSPVEFKINGIKIRGVPDVDGLTLLNYVAALNDPNRATGALLDLLRVAIEPDDYRVFTQAVSDAKMNIGSISEVAGWLLEAYATRPTNSSSDTPDGPSTNGSGPKENSLSLESIQPPSPLDV